MATIWNISAMRTSSIRTRNSFAGSWFRNSADICVCACYHRPSLPAITVVTSPCQPSRNSLFSSVKPKKKAQLYLLASRTKASTCVFAAPPDRDILQLIYLWQYLYIRHNNLYLLALTKRNTNATEILLFLHKIVEVFTEYFKELEEESIRDNFVVIYELLDEMMDFGYPQTTETKILQESVDPHLEEYMIG
jgi:Clathrin adaptor complex small chain